ncbi:hypothetical protein RB195_007655 [Necator americanus]|uniref:Uncharacterized protein n=1 Tax=Necator americanus TaxID=51031 RepID=A0ABR1C0P6_NECAM
MQGCHESVLAQQKQKVHPLNPPASLGNHNHARYIREPRSPLSFTSLSCKRLRRALVHFLHDEARQPSPLIRFRAMKRLFDGK